VILGIAKQTGAPSPVERDRVLDLIRLGRKFLIELSTFTEEALRGNGVSRCQNASDQYAPYRQHKYEDKREG
jgi:hypothetical protein